MRLPRPRGKRIHTALTDAALGDGYCPAKSFFVGRIRDQLQVRHQVANLASIVKPNRSDETVWDCIAAQRVFQRAALCVGPIKYRELIEPAILTILAGLDLF